MSAPTLDEDEYKAALRKWKGALGIPLEGICLDPNNPKLMNPKYLGIIEEAVGGLIITRDPQEGSLRVSSVAKHSAVGMHLKGTSLKGTSLRGASLRGKSEDRIADLEQQNGELCRLAEQFHPHKQFLKTALAFLVFFSIVLTIQLISGIWLIAPALAWLGMAVSASTILLSYLAALDWQDWKSQRAPLR